MNFFQIAPIYVERVSFWELTSRPAEEHISLVHMDIYSSKLSPAVDYGVGAFLLLIGKIALLDLQLFWLPFLARTSESVSKRINETLVQRY